VFVDAVLSCCCTWRATPGPGVHVYLLLPPLKHGLRVSGGSSNLAWLWLTLPSMGSGPQTSAQLLQCQKPCPGADPLLSLPQAPPPHDRSQQSPCLTPPSGSPGRSPSTRTGASPSTSWSCSRWGGPASPSGSTPTVALRPPRSSGASTPAPATNFAFGPTPMSQGSGANL